MSAIERIALVAIVAFSAEVIALLRLGCDDSSELADLAVWKAAFEQRRERKRPRSTEAPEGGYRGVG
jgi:hypothetical protein